MNIYKKELENLTKKVATVLYALDKEMEKPSTKTRGQNIAEICNVLELVNDSTMHFVLNYGWTKINNIKTRNNL